MGVRIRTSKKIAPGVSVVSYQSPGQYLGGLAIVALIVMAILTQLLRGQFGWLVLAVMTLFWLSVLVHGRFLAKAIWSVVFAFSAFTFWTSHGCPGNSQYCIQMQAKIEADKKRAVIERAKREVERCAETSDWRSDPTCAIYTQSEISDAKARLQAREAASAAEERGRLEREKKQQIDEAIKSRDLLRTSNGQK